MKIKVISVSITVIFTAILCYSFTQNTLSKYRSLQNASFATLTVEEQSFIENTLIEKLRKDSIFKVYENLAYIQDRLLASAYVSKENYGRIQKAPTLKSAKQLIDYYESLGIANPEMYAKVEILKQASLISISERFTEMKTMDVESRIKVMKEAKTPLSIGERLRKKAAYHKAIRIHLSGK